MVHLTAVPPGAIAAIVTHLEMTAPPLGPLPPAPDGVELVAIEQPDLAWYRGLYERIGAEWLWFSRVLMRDDQLAAIVRHPKVAVYAVRQAGQDIGLVELDWREEPDCEIAFFGFVAEAVGRGLGQWAMAATQRMVFEAGAARLWLHTCTLDHPAALPFYLAQGFRAYKREVEIAPDPRLSGDLPEGVAAHHPIIADGR